jgi:penicillin-binding protein 2
MAEPSIIFNEVNERQGVFTRRVFMLGGLTAGALGVLTGRLAQIQLVETKQYVEQAKENQFRRTVRIPPRGVILDRNGVALASNRPSFRVMFTPAEAPNANEALDAITMVLGISDDKRESIRRDMAHAPKYRPIELAEDMSWEQFSAVNIRTPELPGVTVSDGNARVYPFGGAFAHVIGYVHAVSTDDFKRPGIVRNELTMNPAYRIGKTGIEKTLEVQLQGVAGAEMNEVDNKGRVVARRPEEDIEPTPGAEVVLTLDADVQNRAMEMFGGESGAAVMMDCRTGDLLCLASAPSFDANAWVKGVGKSEYQALLHYDHKPLFNKALNATFAPGSTFKLSVSLAALAKGIPETTTHTCGGAWPFGNHVYHCDKSHGTLNMHDAIKVSCDIYFYQTAYAVGPELIAQTARKLGLGGVFDIGIPEQTPGIVPDPAWKRQHVKWEPTWYPGDTVSIGIGQGMVNVNALEQAVMVSRLANVSRKALLPRLIKSVGGREQPAGSAVADLDIPPEHLEFVRNAI